MSDPRPILSYAPAPRIRRRTVRWVIWLAVVISIGLAGVLWGPAAWRHGELLYWQHRCMNYTAPAEQVVFDSEPDAAALSKLSEPGYRNCKNAGGGTAMAYVPAERQQRVDLWYAGVRGATLFMHSRRTPSGRERLVIVELEGAPCAAGAMYSWFLPFSTLSTEPAGIFRGNDNYCTASGLLALGSSPGEVLDPRIRVFAGQADPENASHFTIAVDFDGRRKMIDGWLLDSDGVALVARPAWLPATTQAAK